MRFDFSGFVAWILKMLEHAWIFARAKKPAKYT